MDDPELFEIAMSLPPGERESAIREACAGNVEREALLLGLLRVAARGEPSPSEESPSNELEPVRLHEGAIVGRYVVAAFLGQGAFGQVYGALDLELERRVALKILREDRGATEEDERRFRREAQSLAQIDHPNVVRVYDAGEHEGRRYLTMELIEGASLRAWIDDSTGRSWRKVLDVLLPAGRGLQAAHEAGIVHRDFKPENVMIEPGGRSVVTDFGIARVVSGRALPASRIDAASETKTRVSTASTGSVIGTPYYMAPEQFHGRATPRSDQYAFCRVMHEALQTRQIDAPGWLRRVLARGLEPSEEQRYLDMAALIRDVERHRARRRWAARSALVVLVGLPLGYGLLRPPPPTCRQWDEDAVRSSFDEAWSRLAEQTSRAPYPASATAEVAGMQALVEWNLGEWARARTATCEQHVNGIIEPATARVRDECFAEWHAELQRRLEWAEEHPEALGSARLVEELPRNPSRCSYVDAPNVEQPELPDDVRAAIDARLAEAQELRIRGDYVASASTAREALGLADDVGHAAYRAEIHRRLGVLAARSRDPERALELLQQSSLAAERLGLDALASEAHASLAETVALAPSLPIALAEQSLALAQAKVARHGARHDELEADLLAIEGHIAYRNQQYAQAETAYRRAAEHYAAVNGPDDYVAAAMRSNVARTISVRGRHDEAIALAEKSLAKRRNAIGAEHPLIAGDLRALGEIHIRAATAADSPERSDALLHTAEMYLVEAVRLARLLHGPRSLPVASALVELTNVRLRLGEIDEGVAQDVRDYVVVYEDPENKDVTPRARARALRLARNVYHERKAWTEARSIAERMMDLEQAPEPTLDAEIRDDELWLVTYLLKEGRTERARQRLQAHEQRYTGAYPDDVEYHEMLATLRREIDPLSRHEK